MFSERSRILVVGAHCDDEINCAGTLSHAQVLGAQILVVACSDCVDATPDGWESGVIRSEFLRSCESIGVKSSILEFSVRRFSEKRQQLLQELIQIRSAFEPNIVLSHSSTDGHQDHQVVHQETRRAFRGVDLFLGWEASNNQNVTHTNAFVSFDDAALESKVLAWKAYESQLFRKHYDEALLRSLAVVRGRQCRSPTGLAEAFELINLRL